MKQGDVTTGVKVRISFILILAMALVMASGTVSAETPVGPDGRSEVRMVRPETGSVVYSTWREAGRRFVSVSKDDGRTWSEARAMIDEIPLLAGLIVPGESAPAAPKGQSAGEDNRVFIVHFETQSLAEWRRQLRELGVEVLTYIPHNSHLVRMDQDQITAVEAKSFVSWVGPYEPFYRLTPELLADFGDPDAVARRFRLRTFVSGPQDKAALAAEVQEAGGQVVVANPEGYILEANLTDSQALELLASNHLQWIDQWSPPEDDMDNGRIISGADYVLGVDGYDGTGVRAEVMDGNVDADHGDLTGILFHGSRSGSDSHGTCTYGINFGDGTGDAAATGMVPGAQGYFADYSFLSNRYTHTAELVDPSLEYKCVYQSNSWGDNRTTIYNSISAEMDDIIWQYDINIFQSQSNAGNQNSRPQAWAKNIIAVGGAHHFNTLTTADDVWNGPGSDASVGPASDGRVKPDLTFFYDWIYTTDADPGGYVGGPYYADFGGTSGATPMAAGTSGLFFQMWADDVWGTAPGGGTVFDERPHFSTMKALLINTAEQYDFTSTNPDLTRFRQGWGFPNAQNALVRAPLTAVIDESSVLQELETDTYTGTMSSLLSVLKVTLVYSDRAALPGATIHRVNDVTLKVTAPDGITVYWGNNGLTSDIWSSPGGSEDTINTVENVFIRNAARGDWIIEVIASEVNMDVHSETPEDDQDYALVVYGLTDFVQVGVGELFADGFESGDTSAWSATVE